MARRVRWETDAVVTATTAGPPEAAADDPMRALSRHRRQVRVRTIASRAILALAVITLISATRPRLWQPVVVLGEVAWNARPRVARPSLVLAAVVMLGTSRGLRRGHSIAWAGTLAVLAVSAMLHLVHRVDVIPTVLVLAAAGWLALQRASFPVRATRREVRRAALIAGTWLLLTGAAEVLFRLALRTEPEHRSALRDLAADIDLALVVVFVVALVWFVMSPQRPGRLHTAAHLAERERARRVVERWGRGTLDYFALRDDKDWFFVGESVVAHAVRGGVCLVSPDAIGPPGEQADAWAEFLDYAVDCGWSVAVLGASADWLPIYEASGLRAVYLGDEAIVDCPGFSLDGHARKSLRQAVNRVAKAGYTTTFVESTAVDPALRAQIEEVADQSRRGEAERGFSMTLSRLFDPHDAGLMLSVTTSAEGRVDAFCQWAPAPGIDGWSLDVMRRRLDVPDLPNGLIDFTVVRTIEEVAARGQRAVGLNFAVMRDVLGGRSDSRWEDLVRPMLQRLSQQTQMSSLASFNEKFGPSWQPRYVVLDAAEFVGTQALVMAGAEGVTEIPVIGRFLGRTTA